MGLKCLQELDEHQPESLTAIAGYRVDLYFMLSRHTDAVPATGPTAGGPGIERITLGEVIAPIAGRDARLCSLLVSAFLTIQHNAV